jgi:hypothetical protein
MGFVMTICILLLNVSNNFQYKYYIFRHYPSSCLYLTPRPVYFSKHNTLETGFCLRLQVRPFQLGPINRASWYLQTPVSVPRWGT